MNVEKVAAPAAGRMREPGLAEVRRAREDGRWDRAYALDRTARYLAMLPLLRAATPKTGVRGWSGR
ncbi:hypothetical protein [Streptomyces sp. NPDC018947]|uniref:hypothetical protein n=1 Tax=Streptomyces sp. NPDC018947 TaxID=3365054 RepID=UPI0037914E48